MTSGRALAAEFTGTFFLVLIGPGAAATNAFTGGQLGVTGIALAFAFVITGMVVAFGGVSGAHLNPAVTVALAVRRSLPARDVLPYVLAQSAGAVAAGAVIRYALGAHVGAAATTPAIGVGAAFVLELLFSIALMLVILAAANQAFAAAAIGLTVGFCALMGGPLTGASMNPARSLGPAVAAGVWTAHWLYWVAPLTGMIAAVKLHDSFRRPP